jgi:hypothetical protein
MGHPGMTKIENISLLWLVSLPIIFVVVGCVSTSQDSGTQDAVVQADRRLWCSNLLSIFWILRATDGAK